MKENSNEIKTQHESDCVPSYSPMVNIRNVLLEMRDSSDPIVVEFAKKLSNALARDCYCQICGRILKDQPIRNCDVLSEKAANEAWKEYMRSHALPRGGWDFRHIIAWFYSKFQDNGKEKTTQQKGDSFND